MAATRSFARLVIPLDVGMTGGTVSWIRPEVAVLTWPSGLRRSISFRERFSALDATLSGVAVAYFGGVCLTCPIYAALTLSVMRSSNIFTIVRNLFSCCAWDASIFASRRVSMISRMDLSPDGSSGVLCYSAVFLAFSSHLVLSSLFSFCSSVTCASSAAILVFTSFAFRRASALY